MPGSADEAADEAGAAGYRPLLFSIAYGMTGSVGDAEDIVQDAFLGLTRARQAGTAIADPKAYLTTAVTRLGINYLRSARVRRETYVGDWLPEPVVVPAAGRGPPSTPSWPTRCRWRSSCCSRPCPRWSGRCSCCARCSGTATRTWPRLTGKTEVNCRQIFARARQRIAAGRPARGSGAAAGAAGGRRGTGPPVLRGRGGRRHGRAARHARAGRGAPRGRRRQGAGDRAAGGRAAARRAAARRPVPPGPAPRRLPAAGLGQRPAGRGAVRRRRDA